MAGKSSFEEELNTTAEDLSEDQNTTLTTLTATGDYLGQSMLRLIDDPRNFLDDI
jgi:hypothetical protein